MNPEPRFSSGNGSYTTKNRCTSRMAACTWITSMGFEPANLIVQCSAMGIYLCICLLTCALHHTEWVNRTAPGTDPGY